jgi:hypothetical protein
MTWDFLATGDHGAARVHDANVSIDAVQAIQARLYESRTSMGREEILDHFLKTACFTPDDAMARGIIQGIREPIV